MKFRNSRLQLKTLVLVVACALVFSAAVIGPMAWLIDETDTIVNRFVTSDVDIDLDESDEDSTYEMIPGWAISKDPVVTVSADSQDCWVFVKLEKSANYDDYLVHNVDTSVWSQGNGIDIPSDVYYRKVTDDLKDTPLYILAAGSYEFDSVTYTWEANQVLVKPSVTKTMMDELTDSTYPTLSVSSKVVQLMKNAVTEFTAEEAWAIAD